MSVVVLAGVAHAEDAPSWRAAYREGTRLYDIGEYKGALDAFKRAYLAHEEAGILFDIGECHRQLGEKIDAAHAYRGYLRKKPDARNRAEVEALIAQLEGTTPPSAPPVLPPATPSPPPVSPTVTSSPPPTPTPTVAPAPSAPAPSALPPPSPPRAAESAHGSVYDPWGAGAGTAPPPVVAPPTGQPPVVEPASTPPSTAPPAAVPSVPPALAPSVERSEPPRKRSKAWIAAVIVPCAVVLAITIGVSAWYAEPSPTYTKLSPAQ